MYKNYYSHKKQYFNTIYRIEDLKNTFDIYKKYFLKEFEDLNQEDLLKAIQYYRSSHFLFDEQSCSNSLRRYLNDNVEVKKNIADTIFFFENKNKKIETSLFKVLHDLDLDWLKDYDVLIAQEQKILNESDDRTEMKEKLFRFYRSLLEQNIYLTKTYSCFNYMARENLLMRLA